MQLVKALYCKLPTIGKQLPAFLHRVRGLNQSVRGGRQVYYHCPIMAPNMRLERSTLDCTGLDWIALDYYR